MSQFLTPKLVSKKAASHAEVMKSATSIVAQARKERHVSAGWFALSYFSDRPMGCAVEQCGGVVGCDDLEPDGPAIVFKT
jgi:hypothetical protein